MSFGDITVDNTNCIHKIRSKKNFDMCITIFIVLCVFFFFLKMHNSMTIMAISMKVGVSVGFPHRYIIIVTRPKS